MSEYVFRMLGGEEVTVPVWPEWLDVRTSEAVPRGWMLVTASGKKPVLVRIAGDLQRREVEPSMALARVLNRGIGPDRE